MFLLSLKVCALAISSIGGVAFGAKGLVIQDEPIVLPASSKKLSSDLKESDRLDEFWPSISDLDKRSLRPKDTHIFTGREETKIRAEALIKKLDDYTFKLFSNCNYGTGWILDYQIPEQKDKYPIVWYVATNAHVVAHYGFSQNPYKQMMAIDHQRINYVRNRWPEPLDFSNLSLDRQANCSLRDIFGWFDFNMAKQSDGQKLGSDIGAVWTGKMKEPRLFYTSIDFLKEPWEALTFLGTHFKDFAVLEIEFTNEDYAREITRDFATKYPLNSTDAINIFGPSIEDRLSWAEIQKNQENFFSLGYPTIKGKPFQSKVTWNEKTLRGERLSGDRFNWYNNPKLHKKIKGFIDAKRFTLPFGSKKLQYFGHMYLTKGFLLPSGSSGAMYIDSLGNLIGLKSMGESGVIPMHSFVEPIRSKRIREGSINTPEYDLILGSPGQKSSYKQQVEKYVIEKGKSTWLSKRGWKHHVENPRLT